MTQATGEPLRTHAHVGAVVPSTPQQPCGPRPAGGAAGRPGGPDRQGALATCGMRTLLQARARACGEQLHSREGRSPLDRRFPCHLHLPRGGGPPIRRSEPQGLSVPNPWLCSVLPRLPQAHSGWQWVLPIGGRLWVPAEGPGSVQWRHPREPLGVRGKARFPQGRAAHTGAQRRSCTGPSGRGPPTWGWVTGRAGWGAGSLRSGCRARCRVGGQWSPWVESSVWQKWGVVPGAAGPWPTLLAAGSRDWSGGQTDG